jgi:DNA-binding protein H-NS
MSIDLNELSVKELEALIPAIEREIVRRREQQKIELFEKMRAMAEAAGLSLQEVVSGSTAKSTRRRSTPKVAYRDPADASRTWSGRGRRPAWVIEWLGKHGDIKGLEAH